MNFFSLNSLKKSFINLFTHQTIEDQITEELEQWKVDTYAQNSYLMTIPQKRIDQKREEIRLRLTKKT